MKLAPVVLPQGDLLRGTVKCDPLGHENVSLRDELK
nr:MAG TPA: hypothetical protein [Caudoviricetes sp.]